MNLVALKGGVEARCLLLLLPAMVAASSSSASVRTSADWAFNAAALFYFVPDQENFISPVVSGDRRGWHVEARYNYEDLDTVSAWVGGNIKVGQVVSLAFTPMLGGVFGNTSGVAPGYKGSVNGGGWELYSEGEFLVDLGDSADSFFYSWSEFTLALMDVLRLGVVGQRTRVYESDREIIPGFLVGVKGSSIEVKVHVFFPNEEDPTLVISIGGEF